MNLLNDKKTYITAGVGALCWFATQMGWMTQDQFDNTLKGLGVLVTIFLRLAIQKSGPGSTPIADAHPQWGCSKETGADYSINTPGIK